MAINLDQVKRRQATVQPQHSNSYRSTKPHPILKPLLLAMVGIFIVTATVIYGNHTQWQTAQTIQKASHKTAAKGKKQPVVKASQVKEVAAQKHVQPDYSGTGGLSSKADMLKQAQSNQAEILRGHVAVPSFNISEPVYEGTSNHVLAIGAGINAANLKFGTGSVPIFAHNMSDYNAMWPYHPTKFSALQNMTEKTITGKDIYLSDGDTVYRYKAVKLDYGITVNVMNQELAVEDTGKPKVNLIACLEDQEFWQHVKRSGYTSFKADKRIVVTGLLVDQKPMRDMTEIIKQQLQ